jgi:hypothetical protein
VEIPDHPKQNILGTFKRYLETFRNETTGCPIFPWREEYRRFFFNFTACSVGWCWFVLKEEYCWLVAAGWFVLREVHVQLDLLCRACLAGLRPLKNGFGSGSSGGAAFLMELKPFWKCLTKRLHLLE